MFVLMSEDLLKDSEGHFRLLEEEQEADDNVSELGSEYSNPFKSDTESIISEARDSAENLTFESESYESGNMDQENKDEEERTEEEIEAEIEQLEAHILETQEVLSEIEDENVSEEPIQEKEHLIDSSNALVIHCPLFLDSRTQISNASKVENLLLKLAQAKPEWINLAIPFNSSNCSIFVDGEVVTDWQASVEGEVTLIHNLACFSAQIESDSTKTSQAPQVTEKKPGPSLIKRFRQMFANSNTSRTDDGPKLPPKPLSMSANQSFSLAELETFFQDAFSFLSRPEAITEGIFRLSGTYTRINDLQEAIRNGKSIGQLNLDPARESHNVAGLVKQTLRKLPTCLLDYSLMPGWKEVAKCPLGSSEFSSSWSFLFSLLPAINQRIIGGLLRLLTDLLPYEETTRMNSANFGTVIGPNLLFTSNSEDLSATLETSTVSSQIVTNLLSSPHSNESSNLYRFIALARMEYDFTNEDGDGDVQVSLCEGSVIFLLPIEESLDGWWRAVRAPEFDTPFKVPSNYVSIICQVNKP